MPESAHQLTKNKHQAEYFTATATKCKASPGNSPLPPTDNLPHIPTRTRRQETTREKQKQSSYGILCTCGRGGRKRKKKKSRPSGTPRERSVVVLEKVCMQVSLVCVMRCVCVCSAAQAWMAPFFPPHRVKEMNDSLK